MKRTTVLVASAGATVLLCVTLVFAVVTQRPSADSDPGEASSLCTAGTNVASLAMSQSWDSDENTFHILSAGANINSRNAQRLFSGFGALAGSDKRLRVKSQYTFTGSDATGNGVIEYSLNAGGAWTTIFQTLSMNRSVTTDSVVLSAGQDVSQIQVRACVTASSLSGPANSTLNIYDIRVEATEEARRRGAIVARSGWSWQQQ